MDAGSFSSSCSSTSVPSSRKRRTLLQHQPISTHHPPRTNGSRFIPDRSAMDFGMANYLLMQGLKENLTRILSFKSKPPRHEGNFPEASSDTVYSNQIRSAKPPRHIPQSADRTLDVPGIVDEYYLNLLDWGSSNVLAIALESTVYLWDALNGSTSELVSVDEEHDGPVTSVSWAPDGKHIAIGLNSSIVQLWDLTANRKLRTLQGGHSSCVGSFGLEQSHPDHWGKRRHGHQQ